MHFWKMEASGNDFVVIMEQETMEYEAVAREMCERHYGCGADGLLVIGVNPLSMRLFNADGSEAKMCGNGLICVAELVNHLGIETREQFVIQTKAGEKKIQRKQGLCYVNLGSISMIPHELKRGNQTIPYYLCEAGVSHAVFVNSEYKMEEVLSLYESLACNIDLVEYINAYQFQIQTFEKGAGWTWGCGSGVCAAYSVGRTYFDLEEVALAMQRGGEALVSEEMGEIVLCCGSSLVYEGEYAWNN